MICKAQKADAPAAARLATKLWPDQTAKELTADFETYIEGENGAVFLYFHNEEAVAFAQCQLRRDYVEGTNSTPVGYLEGIFVEPEYRKRGFAKALLSACERWVKEQGCTEFASDCELHNEQSITFHLHTGFSEANRVVCFVKRI